MQVEFILGPLAVAFATFGAKDYIRHGTMTSSQRTWMRVAIILAVVSIVVRWTR